MSYYYKVLKDHPIGFWTLDDGMMQAVDRSGCQNMGSYYGPQLRHIPLVSGGESSMKITSSSSIEFPILRDYYVEEKEAPFATHDKADNEFTFECWIYPKITSTDLTPIFADLTNNVGIFWENNNLIFALDTESLEYSIPIINRSMHLVCTYSPTSASIYINGDLVVTKLINSNPFENTTLLLKSGPTINSTDEFLIDDIAAYRYVLSEKNIKEHYIENNTVLPIQISYPDNGEIFNLYDNGMRTSFSYNYPKDKSWEYFLNSDITLNRTENYIQIAKTDTQQTKEIIIEDIISMPSGISMDSSKLYWEGNNGISVYTSLDGISYEQCDNGYAIPQYTYDSFSEQRFIYIRIVLESSDSSKYIPTLYSLSINFYSEQIIYSKNGGSYISKILGKDYNLGKEVYPVLSTNILNGIYVPANSGFNINIPYELSTIEFFYMPNSLSQSSLITGAATDFNWNTSGVISKNNINKIYVNGQDKSSETDISNVFTPKYLNHVVVILDEPESEEIVLNYKSPASVPATYQHISLYKYPLGYNQIVNHYELYTGKSRYIATGSSLAMTENSISLYNNDWLVIQNS